MEEASTIHPDGRWSSALVERVAGSAHAIAATHIHRFVALPAEDCWTLVRAGPHERTTCF